MYTPNEAMRTWCPLVRLGAISDDGGSVPHGQTVMNRLQRKTETIIPDAAVCIADKCAMWRWHQPFKSVKGGPLSIGSFEPDGQPTKGYCGVAGRPEVAS